MERFKPMKELVKSLTNIADAIAGKYNSNSESSNEFVYYDSSLYSRQTLRFKKSYLCHPNVDARGG